MDTIERPQHIEKSGDTIMPIPGSSYSFSQENINKAPTKPGVYALLDSAIIIYYGKASKSIQNRLQRHFNGDEGLCTKGATHYKREETTTPVAREKELLAEYQNSSGQLPRCNDVMP